MRVSGLIALVAVCASACASGGGSAVTSRPVTQDISTGGAGGTGRLTIGTSTGPNLNDLAHTADQVWKVLPAAFDSIGVPVTHLDPASKTIGNDGFRIRQRLGNTYLSRFFDCGQTQIGQNADSYDMYITLLVQVQATGATSRLVTTLEASARPLTFSQAYSRCSSKGALESRLLKAITAQLK